ncbi:uncharacterized protein HMPREF1541_01007 [Cyphellophora europaea CBS 101466]|uniref:SHSP domain-containing protein n=1 Tax=Cyphellophora europaea (strain CBS 101466) TaxID=1220924 RepID=W2SFK8_CYPE1|nr:uncharacterized protein HMPREF1541_01007 [Cyphellophora europaea CBS 101466]ETN46818.1 hypothetical protein HMPREF1541_01007 [Cyphellophora europaea CBS 101466]
MPSLNHLNPPPNPFWDFVANLDEHPLFAAYAPNNNVTAEQQQQQQQQSNEAAGAQESSEKAQGKQPAADDPPVVDPSTATPGAAQPEGQRGFPFRGRGRHHGPSAAEHEGRRGPGCRGRGGFGGFSGRGGPFGGPHGPPFMFGPPPFWTGPRHHSHPHRHHQRGPPREREEPTGQGFNLGDFLNSLGERLGVDLTGAAENLGLDKYSAPPRGEDVDFEPRSDIFDTPSSYVVHLSLPGAKKQDVGVDWDGENSVLRVTGVVHRPDVDEQMLAQLVVNGRKRENGVFEKAIRLGTKRDPANIDVSGITAKMTDGVLVVKVPKVEREIHKREVPISGSSSPAHNEKDLLFDADEEMYDAPRDAVSATAQTKQTSTTENDKSLENKAKEDEAREDRSVTAGREEDSEQLPAYEGEEASDKMSDWEKDSDEEADYVKINVD